MSDERQTSPYDAAIDDLRAKRAVLCDAFDKAIQFLEALRDGTFMADVGVPSAVMGATPSATILGSGLGPAPASNGATQAIPAGTFHGLSIEAAVKKLLLMRRKTLGAQEIAASLREGGLPLQSETPANTVTSILHRAFTRGGEVVRIGRGQWGLQEWYPNQRFNRKGTED